MLSAIPKAYFARSLYLSSVARFAKPAATARHLLLVESRRTFLTTASVAKAETAKQKKATKDKGAGDSKVAKKHMKIPIKRPSSSWQNFYRQYLKEHMKEGEKYTAYSTEASAIWKTMSAEEKAACTQKYGASDEESGEYRKLLKEYRSTHETSKKARKPKIRRDAPMNGYNLFIKENYDKTSPVLYYEQTTTLAKLWREISSSDKDAYKQRAIEIHKKRKAEAAEK